MLGGCASSSILPSPTRIIYKEKIMAGEQLLKDIPLKIDHNQMNSEGLQRNLVIAKAQQNDQLVKEIIEILTRRGLIRKVTK